MDPITTFERAIDTASSVLGNIAPDQLDKPTPCPNYDVKSLATHLAGAVAYFGAAAKGEKPGGDPPGDPKAAFDAAAADLLSTWRQPGMLDKTLTLPWGDTPAKALVQMASMEALTHAWDLARATGQSTAFPEDLSSEVLAAAKANLQPQFRSTEPDASFGPEVEAPADAHPADKLAAFMGRQP